MNNINFTSRRIILPFISILGVFFIMSCNDPQSFNKFQGKWKTEDAFYTLSYEKGESMPSASVLNAKYKKIVKKTDISNGVESEGIWRIEGDVLFFDFPTKGFGIFSGLDLTTTESFEINYLFEDAFWATKRSDKNKNVKFTRTY